MQVQLSTEDILKTQVQPSTDMASINFKKEVTETSISARFEQQVEIYPHHLAIKTKNEQLTYAELNQMANRIARTICAQGQEGAEPVVLLLEPGLSLIASILGILKAGKFWVLLDPSHPLDRISYILEDSQAGLILSNRSNLPLAKTLLQKDRLLINIDEIDTDINDDNLNLVIPPDAFAHIIYTSGSTGQPKGVVHNHRVVLHNIWVHTNSFGIYPNDRLALFASLSHQSGIADLFRALLNGATLLPYNLKKEGVVNLPAWLKEEAITIYHSVPTVFRNLMDTLNGASEFPHIRVIHLGGEPVLKHDVALYKKYFASNCVLVIILGASEVPTFRHNFINKDTEFIDDTIPVGYAVDDKELFLLDDQGQKVGYNEVGEITVHSCYVASEYWRKPELTEAAFLADLTDSNKKIYRTGDLGKILPDGSLVYLGRKDKQVKIAGQRVEIGEIETALFDYDSIKSCAVLAKDNNLGEKYLSAYIVPQPTSTPTVNELQDHLGQKLPIYMIPSRFAFLDEIPLLPNGKVDRTALQGIDDSSRPNLETELVLPRDDLQRQLKIIWEEILDIQPIGIKDNFFELGATSIHAGRLLTVIAKTFDKRLAPPTIYQAPTIEQLAAILQNQEWSATVSSLVAIQTEGDNPPFFCVPGNMSDPFKNLKYLTKHLGSDQPFYGFQDGLQNPSKIEDLATIYLSELSTIQPEGPYYLGGLCGGGVVAFEMAQQLRTQGHEVALLALMEPVPPKGGLRAVVSVLGVYWRRISRRLTHHSKVALQLTPEEQKNYVRLKMKLNANSWALSRYAPRPYPGRIDLFLTPETLDPSTHPRLAWRDKAADGAEIHPIPGSNGSITGHDSVEIQESHIRILAQKLRACIDNTLKK